MECVFQTLIDLDDIFNEKENKVRLFGSETLALSNNDKGLAEVSEGKPDPLPLSGGTSTNKQQQKSKNVVPREDLPWDLLKKLNSCLPLTARFKICEDTVRDTVIIYYKNLLERLLNSVERVSFDETWKRQVLEGIFINGCHDQAILILCKTLQIQAQKSFKQDVVISILEKFFSGESLSELMFHQCYFKSSLTHHQFSINSNIPNPHWELLLSYLVHLPDKMTNKMRGKPRYPFDKASYVALFCQALVEALSQLSVELSRGKKINLDFLSQFLGRMCLSGNGEEIFKNITPIILSECHDNLEWRRVTKYLIVNVPDRCLENVLKPLLSNIPWYGYVKYFWGEILRKHGTIYFIVTKKFILINHFEDPIVLQNCIGYLANDAMAENKSNLFLEVVHFILESWSESTSMKYLSSEQRYNWTCALAMLSPDLKGRNFEAYKRPFLSLLMAGVQLRIESPSHRIRVHGMFIGELLTAILEPDMPQLQLEYEKTPEILKLISYSQPKKTDANQLDNNRELTDENDVLKYKTEKFYQYEQLIERYKIKLSDENDRKMRLQKLEEEKAACISDNFQLQEKNALLKIQIETYRKRVREKSHLSTLETNNRLAEESIVVAESNLRDQACNTSIVADLHKQMVVFVRIEIQKAPFGFWSFELAWELN